MQISEIRWKTNTRKWYVQFTVKKLRAAGGIYNIKQ